MENKNELVRSVNNDLLDIFESDTDRNGSDLLAMSNFFSIYIDRVTEKLRDNNEWEQVVDAANFLGQVAAALKSGFDVSSISTMIADTSHFSKEIVEGLKSGLYHLGESKEVNGNFRPAILDDKERLVKFVTLKKALNPSELLSDVSTLSIQASLKNVTSQIQDVSRDVRRMSDFVRREALSTKFINARDRIMLVATDVERREQYLLEADKYLMEGLNSLYADMNDEVTKLMNSKGPFKSLDEIDGNLSCINEDMQMIPQYVGLRVHLMNYMGKNEDVKRIVREYSYQLSGLTEKKLGDRKYSAVEMIHKYYPYSQENMDFWLTEPTKMEGALKSYENLLGTQNSNVIYIDMEDAEDE